MLVTARPLRLELVFNIRNHTGLTRGYGHAFFMSVIEIQAAGGEEERDPGATGDTGATGNAGNAGATGDTGATGQHG